MSEFLDELEETAIEKSSIIEGYDIEGDGTAYDVDGDFEPKLKDVLYPLLAKEESDVVSESTLSAALSDLDVDVELDGQLKGIWDNLPADDEVSMYSSRALDVDVEIDGRLKGIWNKSGSLPLNDDEVSLYSTRALDTYVELDAGLKGIWDDLVDEDDYCPPMDVDVEIDGELKGIWP